MTMPATKVTGAPIILIRVAPASRATRRYRLPSDALAGSGPAIVGGDRLRRRPQAMTCVVSDAHDGDDLLYGRRIGRIPQPLVARRSAAVEAGHGRRRPAAPCGVEQDRIDHAPTVPRERPRRHALGYRSSSKAEATDY